MCSSHSRITSSHYVLFHYLTLCDFFIPVLTGGFPWRPSDCKPPHVSRTLLSILVDLNSAVVWMNSILFVISSSSSLLVRPLRTVPKATTTTGINVTIMFHSFFSSVTRPKYWSIFFHFLLFSLSNLLERQNAQDDKFFSFCWLTLDLAFWPGLSDPFVSQRSREFYASNFLG